MLRYKILRSDEGSIQVPLELRNIDVSNPSSDFETNTNTIISYEKNGYRPTKDISMSFYIHNGLDYELSLESLFDFTTEMNKNVFKKSNLVLEFYEQGETLTWIGSETIPLSSGNYKPARRERVMVEIRDGFKYEWVDFPPTVEPKFNVGAESQFLSDFFFYRDFSQFKDKVEGEGRIFMRAILQNAKSGERIYFINGHTHLYPVNKWDNYTFYHEIRCREDYTYRVMWKNAEIENIVFKEMVGN